MGLTDDGSEKEEQRQQGEQQQSARHGERGRDTGTGRWDERMRTMRYGLADDVRTLSREW